MRSASLVHAFGLVGLVSLGCTTQIASDEGLFDPSTTATSTSGTGTAETTDETGDTTSISVSSSGASGDEDPGDSSSSEGGGGFCGDGVISGTEQCDCGGAPCTAEGLGNMACEDVNDPLAPGKLTGGALGCNPASCKFDTSNCTYCGDGEVNGIEGCEPNLPIETDCEALGEGTLGELSCDSRTCEIDASACTDCGYAFDFSSCPDGWTVGSTNGQASQPTWECGNYQVVPTGPMAGHTGVWATNLSGTYGVNESSYVQSPALNLSACQGQTMTMTLTHWFNFEGGISNSDGGIVQISTNGSNWTTIAPAAGAMYGGAINASFAPVDGAAGFGGNLATEQMWVTSDFDLSSYAGEDEVYVRFVLGSDNSNNLTGWYLDDVQVLGGG